MMFRDKAAVAAVAAFCLSCGAGVRAAPNDYVRMPTVQYGEREIDYKTGVQRNRNGSSESANSIGVGFTPTQWWFTEVYAKHARPPGEPDGFDAWEWENRFQLTETGRYPVDAGLLLEIERPKDPAEGYEVTIGPMFQMEWGRIQGNFNAFLQKHVRATEHFDAELRYQMQVKHRDAERLEWGAQAFGNVGQWDHWSPANQQEFKVGPALFGKFRTGPRAVIKWNAALLAGTTSVTPGTTLRFQGEFEF